MGKRKQKSVSSRKLLKAIDKSLDALEDSRKHDEKAAKKRDKAIAALLELEALVEDAKNCACGKTKPSDKEKGSKKKKQVKQPDKPAKRADVTALMGAVGISEVTTMDDLEMIAGVGPKLAETLNELGISTYRQIAEWTEDDISRIDEHLNFRGRIQRENWIDQAKALASGGREEYVRVFGKEPR